jgi:hypothetical protein
LRIVEGYVFYPSTRHYLQYRHTRRNSRVCLVWIRRAMQDHCYRLHQTRLRAVVLQWVTRMPENDIKKEGAPRCHLRDECGGPLRSMSSCNAIAL